MYELHVAGMSCSHCIQAVMQSIHKIDAAAQVNVDLEQQKICIVSEAKLEELQAAVEDAGYPIRRSTTLQ